MYERMLNKKVIPTEEIMEDYCEQGKEHFVLLNKFLLEEIDTEKSIRFPYGNNYGWAITHRKKKKLICDLLVEKGAFTLMIRLQNKNIDKIYQDLHKTAKNCIDNKYPCGEGGWTQFRILTDDDLEDAKKMIQKK